MRRIYLEAGRPAFVDCTDGKQYADTELEVCINREQLLEMLNELSKTEGEDLSLFITGASRVTRSQT